MNSQSPFLLVFTNPRQSVQNFLKNPDYKNIAIFLFLLSSFLSLFGQYPKNTFVALSALGIIFGGNFLYAFLLFSWGKNTSKGDYWSVFGALSIAIFPLILGRIILIGILTILFGNTALYNGLQSIFDMPKESLTTLLIIIEVMIFSAWSLYAEVQSLSQIQKIRWGTAFIRIVICSFTVTLLSASTLSLLLDVFKIQ